MFEISLTATQETADEVLHAFIASVPQFDVKETRTRSSNNYGKCYIYLQLTPNGSASAAHKGGRPPKLSAAQIADIRARLRSDVGYPIIKNPAHRLQAVSWTFDQDAE